MLGQIESVKVLLRHGANFRVVDEFDNTLLHIAASHVSYCLAFHACCTLRQAPLRSLTLLIVLSYCTYTGLERYGYFPSVQAGVQRYS
jgi:ankyrin repeat protein